MTTSDDNKVLLARMRVAVCRVKLMQAYIEEVGALLGAGRITTEGAIYWLRENDVLDLCLSADELRAIPVKAHLTMGKAS